jgi:hypothetical protein
VDVNINENPKVNPINPKVNPNVNPNAKYTEINKKITCSIF